MSTEHSSIFLVAIRANLHNAIAFKISCIFVHVETCKPLLIYSMNSLNFNVSSHTCPAVSQISFLSIPGSLHLAPSCALCCR